MIKNDILYEDAEFSDAVQMVTWMNAQIARHQFEWVLSLVTTSMHGDGTHWCGLAFETRKDESPYPPIPTPTPPEVA